MNINESCAHATQHYLNTKNNKHVHNTLVVHIHIYNNICTCKNVKEMKGLKFTLYEEVYL